MATDYDLIVLGGGAAGLTASGMAAHLGARVLMIEKNRLGGDCTWTGCVPSKSLLRAAKSAHEARRASDFGIHVSDVSVDFSEVMHRLRNLRREIYEDADAPDVYEAMGVEVRHGSARFLDKRTVQVGNDAFRGRRLVVATGARPAIPPVEGLDAVPYLTSETLFEIETLPARLAILGAGPIGVEMAQAFQRLGSEVTVIDKLPSVLRHEDDELSGQLQAALEHEGVRFVLGHEVASVEIASSRDESICIDVKGVDTISCDRLLVATGRRPNVEDLGLESAGVAFGKQGIDVDDRCRTSQSGIYAAGDVTGRYAFTHMSEHMAKTAVMNALLKLPVSIDKRAVPRVTFTDPELAHVGATAGDLQKQGARFETLRFPYSKIDRAITDRQTTGLIKVHVRPLDGKILGASILGAHAGDTIAELTVAMRNRISLRKISDTIHPYPSYGLGVRRAADQWYVQRRSPFFVRLLKGVMGYQGPVLEYGPDDIL